MNRKSLIGIFAIAGLLSVTALSVFLSQQKTLTQKRSIVNKAAETTTAADPRAMVFSVPDGVNNFPILNLSTPNVTPLPGLGSVCLTGNNTNKEWMLWDISDNNPVCGDTDNTSTACPGADLAKETNTARFCYWKNEKKFNLGINTQNMQYKGCYLNRDQTHINTPGSYSTYVMWGPRARNDYNQNPHFNLKYLQDLRIQTKLSTDFYSQSVCPVTPNPTVPAPQLTQYPYYGGNHPAAAPHAFFYFSFLATNQQLGRAIFYQPQPWDNRYEEPYLKQGKDPKDDPNTIYKNCKFGAPEWFVIGEPIGALGAGYARPGAGPVSYDVDILPRLKYWINTCMNEYYGTNKEYDLEGWRISGLNFGNEEGNTPIMTNTLIDPKVVTTLRNDISTEPISTTQPLPINGTKISSITARASKDNGNPAQNAVDNNINTNWHAGDYPSQWIELDLQTQKSVAGLQLRLNQAPNGYSQWRIYGGQTPNPTTLLKEVGGITKTGEWLTVPITSNTPFRYMRVEAVLNMSHVSIFEINTFEGQPPTLTPTPTPLCPTNYLCTTQSTCSQLRGAISGISCGSNLYCCYKPGSTTVSPTPTITTAPVLPTQTLVPTKPSISLPTATPPASKSSNCPQGFSCRTSVQCRLLGGSLTGLSCGSPGMYCCYGK